jgi:NAD(P)-dependent dehydrogenase (short-subunit alcohol dehydrogenase family)
MAQHDGKVVMVTGAAQGIGEAICKKFISEGARVVAVDIHEQNLQIAVDKLGINARAFVADVSLEKNCAAAVAFCVEEFGKIDVLAAHAGIAEPRAFLEIDEAHWNKHMGINVNGALYCALHVAREMVKNKTRGVIIYTASINGFHVEQSMVAYNVSKGALLNLVRSTAIDLGQYGIRVNGIAPGVIDTPISTFVIHNEAIAPTYLKTIPLARFGEADEVANVVSWLASSESSYVTGHTVVIDGGQTLGIAIDLESV